MVVKGNGIVYRYLDKPRNLRYNGVDVIADEKLGYRDVFIVPQQGS
jgi:hypothetical protein